MNLAYILTLAPTDESMYGIVAVEEGIDITLALEVLKESMEEDRIKHAPPEDDFIKIPDWTWMDTGAFWFTKEDKNEDV